MRLGDLVDQETHHTRTTSHQCAKFQDAMSQSTSCWTIFIYSILAMDKMLRVLLSSFYAIWGTLVTHEVWKPDWRWLTNGMMSGAEPTGKQLPLMSSQSHLLEWGSSQASKEIHTRISVISDIGKCASCMTDHELYRHTAYTSMHAYMGTYILKTLALC